METMDAPDAPDAAGRGVTVTIEQLAPGDVLAWTTFVAREQSRTYLGTVHDGFLDDQLAFALESAPGIVAAVEDGSGAYAVAWHDGAIVGAASSGPCPMPWETFLDVEPAPAARSLDKLYVAPGLQGTGLADRLLEAVVDERPTVLWLIEGNDRARRFYERRDWTPFGAVVSAGPSWAHVPMRRLLRG